MNDKSRDDSDFSLNHFDASGKENTTAPAAEPDTDRQEPVIPETIPEPEPAHSSAGQTADEEPVTPPTVERKSRSSFNPVTIFTALLILIVAVVFWSNIDDSKNTGVSTEQETDLFPATGLRIQSLDNRITSLEQQAGRQNNALMQQVERLQEQVNTLTRQVNEQARILHAAPAGMAATHQPKPTRHSKAAPAQAAKAVQKATRAEAPASVKTQPAAVARKKQHTAQKSTTSGWVVSLVSVDSLAAAKKAQADFASKGVNTEISQGQVRGKTWYRVRVAGFANKQEALTQQQYLSNSLHIKDTWVHKL